MKKLATYLVLLGVLSTILYQWVAGIERPRVNRINPTLNSVIRDCANENAITLAPGSPSNLTGMTETQERVVLGCVLVSVANEGLPEVAVAHMQAIFQFSPSLKEPEAASLLIPALFRADSLEAARYLIENSAVLEAKDIRQMSHEDYAGLSVIQYQSLRGNMDVVAYLIRNGFSFNANDNGFVHAIYDVHKYRFLSPEFRALLLQHDVDIEALDQNGYTVVARAQADGERVLNDAFLELGAVPEAIVDDAVSQAAAAAISIPASTYSLEQHLRADPAPINAEETLFLYDKDRTVYAEHWNWRTESGKSHRLQLASRDGKNRPNKYYTVVNQHGFWILGPRSALITPDDEIMSVDISLDASQAHHNVVALDDGSLLVLRPALISRGQHVEGIRIHLTDPGTGEVEGKVITASEEIESGSVAIKLSDGRVLVAGGGYHQGKQSWLYDPDKNQWSQQGDTSTRRSNPAIAALPDGRAFIAGNSSAASRDDEGTAPSAYSAEIWNPDTGRWTPLPSMPLSYRTEAYRAMGSSATTLPDGSLVIAGGMHNQVMLLRSEGDTFADHWTIIGDTFRQRVGARVQALGMNEIVILGGAGLSPSDQCCWTVSGAERIEIPEDGAAYRANVGLTQSGAGVAHRGEQTFIAGGWQQYSLGSQTVQGSAVAEIIDNTTQLTRPLPPLPSPALIAQALWLDEHQILVKAKRPKGEINGEFKLWDSRSLEASFEGYLAILDTRTGQWRTENNPQIAGSTLAGRSGDEVILIDPEFRNWALNPGDFSIRELPPRIADRDGAVARITRDDRIIVAGGLAQKELLLAESSTCTDDDCPQEWFAFGGIRPSNRYEIWDPATNSWRLGVARQGRGRSVAIAGDGRVFALGWNGAQWLIEVSDSDGEEWQTLPMPDELSVESQRETPSCGDESRYAPHCSMFTGEFGNKDFVFLRSDYWGQRRDTLHALWVFDETEKQWLLIGKGLLQHELNEPRALPLSVGGRTILGAYFATGVPRIWQD